MPRFLGKLFGGSRDKITPKAPHKTSNKSKRSGRSVRAPRRRATDGAEGPPAAAPPDQFPTADGDSDKSSKSVRVATHTTSKAGGPKIRVGLNAAGKQAVLAFSATTYRKGIRGLQEEFAKKKRTNNPSETQAFIQNATAGRNRYKDVACLDNCRIILRDWKTDYIHANYVSTPSNERRFICTQGPTDATCPDFWHMVVQEKSKTVIMLCNTLEKGMKKCAEYFPTAEAPEKTFDCYTLNLKLPQTEATIGMRTIGVFRDGNPQPHTVTQYHWKDWPDRGVPKADMAIIKLLDAIQSEREPVVVHCSAGIGRTGSLVMIDFARDAAGLGNLPDSLEPIVDKIRSQRSASVQTDQQYLFVHQVLLEYYRFQREIRMSKDHEKFTADYNKTIIL